MTKQKNGQEIRRDNLQMRIYKWPDRDVQTSLANMEVEIRATRYYFLSPNRMGKKFLAQYQWLVR